MDADRLPSPAADRLHALVALCREYGLGVSPQQTVALFEDLSALGWHDRGLLREAAVSCLARDESEADQVRRLFDAVFGGRGGRPRRPRKPGPAAEEAGGAEPASWSPITRPAPGKRPRDAEPRPPAPPDAGTEPAPRLWEKPGHSRRAEPSQGTGAGLGSRPQDSPQAFLRFLRERAPKASGSEPGPAPGGGARGSHGPVGGRADRAPRPAEPGSRQAGADSTAAEARRLAERVAEWVASGALESAVGRRVAALGPAARPYLSALRDRLGREPRHSVERRRLERALRELALALHARGDLGPAELASAVGASLPGVESAPDRPSRTPGAALRDIEVLRDVVEEFQGREDELPAVVARLSEALQAMTARRSASRAPSDWGRVHVGRTLRASLGTGGLPLDLRLTERRREADVLLFLDTSGSQLWWAGAALLAAHALGRVAVRFQAFTFASRIADATRFVRRPAAFFQDLRAFGGASDYQRALEELLSRGRITSSTTVLLVGDCRDYLGHWETRRVQGSTRRLRPESARLMERLARRARRVVILNPEEPEEWGVGDSAALHYRDAGAVLVPVRTPLDLARQLSASLR